MTVTAQTDVFFFCSLSFTQPKQNQPTVEPKSEIKDEPIDVPEVGSKKAKKVFTAEKLQMLREEKVR